MNDREFIEYLRDTFAEKRSDVSDMCTEYLEKGTIPNAKPEHRFIYATVPNTNIQIEYDTLTTLISYRNKMDESREYTECIKHKYVDEDAMFMRGQYE